MEVQTQEGIETLLESRDGGPNSMIMV